MKLRFFCRRAEYFCGVNKHPIIFFDGVCNLCNSAVQFIIKRDRKDIFRFASLQSEAGQRFLREKGLPETTFNSFILVEGDRYYTQSTAALRMLKQLGRGWPLLFAFIIIPRFLRDAIYKWIAANRYKWFGKKEECWIPTPALKAKFLD